MIAKYVTIVLFSLLLTGTSPVEVSVATTAHLSFGKIAANNGGSVTMSPHGARTAAGSVALLTSVNGSNAAFNIQGSPSTAYIITLPTNSEVVMTSEAHSIRVTDFTVNPGLTGSFGPSGNLNVTIGATMTVDANKTPGIYSGHFSIMIDYQ